jgi:hypothetical protein
MGFSLPNLYYFDFMVETFVIEFVMIPLYPSVLIPDDDSTYSASTSFWRLLLVFSEGSNRLALIYTHFASETALHSPLRGPSHLFDPFPTLCLCFHTIVFHLGSSAPSFWIRRSKNDPPL